MVEFVCFGQSDLTGSESARGQCGLVFVIPSPNSFATSEENPRRWTFRMVDADSTCWVVVLPQEK